MAIPANVIVTNTKGAIDAALAILVANDQAVYTAFVAWVDAVRAYFENPAPQHRNRAVDVTEAFNALKAAVNV